MAFGKNKPLRPIDQQLRGTASADVSDVVALVDTPDAAPTPRAPWGLAASTDLDYSDRTAVAKARFTWNAPTGSEPSSYELQIAADSDFTTPTSYAVPRPSADGDPAYTVRSLQAATTYYARVRAKNYEVYTPWSSTISLTTPADDVVPSSVSSAAASFGADGMLIVTATTPSEANFAGIQITIKGSAGGPTYTTQKIPLQGGGNFRWLWPAQDNVRLSGGGDASLTIEIRSGNWSGYYQSSGATLTATKAAPSVPSVTTSWDSQSGELSFVFSEASFTTATLTIDGVSRTVTSPYIYSAAQNATEHSGTAASSVAWSIIATDALGQSSSAATGTATLPRPADVAGATATWSRRDGTATFTWGAVTGVARYRLTIDGVARTVGDVRYDYSASRNRVEHSGTADNSLTWSIVAIDGLGQTSATPASGTATLAPPDAPSEISTDFTTRNAAWKWAAVLDCDYILTIHGVARTLTTPSYDYSFELNAAEHSGTATPSLPWSLVAVDGLGQTSATPASGTLTNVPPAAPTGITLTPGATGFIVSITSPAVLDLSAYVVRIIRNGSTVETLERTVASFAYMAAGGSGTYTVGVLIRDVFSQTSSEYATPTGTTVDVLTTAELRADCLYSDSSSTAPATLAALKDDSATPVVTYASGTTWKWTKATRATAYRVGNIVLIASAGMGYVGISDDDTTYTYFAGPLASDGQTLTAYASEAAAQGAALALPTTKALWSLPSVASVRYIKLFHRNTSASYSLAEFYPPTLVVVDNLRAGLIRGMTIVGDQMVANQLSALSAYLGAVDISGWCTIGSAGGIWQGSAGTPAAPVTGFKLYQSATGKGLWETWLAGVRQVYIGDDMALYAGAGSLRLNQLGMRLYAGIGSSADPSSSLRWYRSLADADTAWVGQTYFEPSSNTLYMLSAPPTSTGGAHTVIRSQRQPGPSFSTVYSEIDWRGGDTSRNPRLTANVTSGTLARWILTPLGMIVEGNGGGDGSNDPQGALDVLGDIYAGGSFYGTDFRAPSSTDTITIGIDGATTNAFFADTNNTYINAIGTNGLAQLRVAGATKAYADKNGNFTATNAFFPGGQGAYYLYYDAATFGTATNNNFKAGGNITAGNDVSAAHDIYLGTRSTWLSSWLNQALKTTDSPTFSAVTFADNDTGIFNNGDGRAIIRGNNVNVAAWLAAGSYPGFYIDFANNCTSDSINWGLRFGSEGSGEGISGPRAGTNQYGVTIWTGFTARMQIGSNGNVSIGTSFAPTADKRLAVRGVDATSSNYALFVQNGSAVNLFYVRNDGYVWSTTAIATSDRRLKKNIRYLDEEESDRILDLAPVEYTLRMNERRMYGHIAQDVQSIDELLVAEGDQGMLGIHESGILALAVLRIQQHERRIDRLEARLAALEAAA